MNTAAPVPVSGSVLGALFASNKVTSVVLIDDNAARVIRHEIWIVLRQILEDSDSQTATAVANLLESNGLDYTDELPPADFHQAILDLLQSACEAARTLVENARFGEGELDRLYEYLGHSGIPVTPYSSPETAPYDAQLYFVDYNIGETPGTEGKRAESFLIKLMESHRPHRTCPAVILMSRQEPGPRQWGMIANNAHVVRFCFRYRDKQELVESEQHLAFHLMELFDTFPLAQQYVGHVETLRLSLASAAQAVANDLLRLTPADFCAFASTRMGGDALSSARHVRFLFSALLEQALCGDTDVAKSLTAFVSSLSSKSAVVNSDGVSLHDLQGRILYDRTPTTIAAPLGFGDILVDNLDSPNRFFLVVTPECDLEVRAGGNAKAESVLMIEGAFVTVRAFGESLEHTALMNGASGEAGWIEWNLKKLCSLEYKVLRDLLPNTTANKRKWGSLRFQFAERLQNHLATDLLEVGTEEFMEGYSEASVAVFLSQDATEHCGMISLCHMRAQKEEKKSELALGEDVGPLLTHMADFGMTVEEILALRRLSPRGEFITKLKQFKLFLFSNVNGTAMALVRLKSGDVNTWIKPGDWGNANPITK
ncbi:MAG: hypothetical protein JWP89_1635 [Schlesneria sp.]|nr:hypothetical protein [Schlesneria sp.]